MNLLRPLPEGGGLFSFVHVLYIFLLFFLLLRLGKQFLISVDDSSVTRNAFAGCFLDRIGGATTFASAKFKDAIGRIGIFFVWFLGLVMLTPLVLQYVSTVIN